jgi:hypothetical protein
MNSRYLLAYSTLLFIVLSLSCSSGQRAASKLENDEILKEMNELAADSNTAVLVTLRRVGKTIPGAPKVSAIEDSASTLFERMGMSAEIAQTGPDKWIALLRAGQTYVIGWLTEDKKLFGYTSEPFIAASDLEVKFSPGMPASFEYDLTKIPDKVSVLPAEILLPIKTISDGREIYLSWGENQTIDKSGIVKIKGLAPGKYEIIARSKNSQQLSDERSPFLYDRRKIEIKQGVTNRFTAIYPEIDSTVEAGDVTIRGYIVDPLMEPLTDTIVQLVPFDNMNIRTDLYYPDAKTDSNGLFIFTGVRPKSTIGIKSNKIGALIQDQLMKEGATISIIMVAGPPILQILPGREISDIVVDFKEGEEKLSDIGKTAVVTLWAGWEPLCRQALSNLNTLAGQKENVAFITLGLDVDRNKWEKTVENSGWTKLRHGWYDQLKNSHSFNKPIPFMFIIDKDHIVRAAGYNLDVAAELEKIEKARN